MIQTTLPDFQRSEFSVVRQHEEFIWLHDQFEENEDYAGFIVSIEIYIKEHIYLITILSNNLLNNNDLQIMLRSYIYLVLNI